MLRADKPSCGNEILHSRQMALFTAQALLVLGLVKRLLSGSEKTSLSAVRLAQHRQCSGALTLLVLKVVSACRRLSGGNLSSSKGNSHVLIQHSLTAGREVVTRLDLWHFPDTQHDFLTVVFQLEVSLVPAPHPPRSSQQWEISDVQLDFQVWVKIRISLKRSKMAIGFTQDEWKRCVWLIHPPQPPPPRPSYTDVAALCAPFVIISLMVQSGKKKREHCCPCTRNYRLNFVTISQTELAHVDVWLKFYCDILSATQRP